MTTHDTIIHALTTELRHQFQHHHFTITTHTLPLDHTTIGVPHYNSPYIEIAHYIPPSTKNILCRLVPTNQGLNIVADPSSTS